MPVRYDRHIGSLEILSPTRSAEGFLKVHGIIAKTGVLHYRDADGLMSAELIPPEELISAMSLETVGGKPFVNEHPTDAQGSPVLVTPENSDQYTRGTIGNDPAASRETGFVRVTIDVHDADTIADIDAGKLELSSGRTIDRLDSVSGVWDGKTQQYWTGAEAEGKDGVKFDKIQRGIRHNHVALVDRGRAGNRVSLRMDSGDAISADPPNNGGRNMAKVRLDSAEYEVDAGFASAFSAHQTAAKVVTDGLNDTITELTAGAVKASAEFDALKIKADAAVEALDAIDVKALVKARVKLVDSVAKLKIDGLDDMTDREVMVAAIKTIKADYDDTGVSDDHVAIRFDVMIDAGALVPVSDDGRSGLRNARNDSATVTDVATKRAARNAARGYKASIARQKER